jgi:hypothetical protein
VASSDDPEYAATLAGVLGNAGHSQEAERWRISAAARYDALVLRHPEAFIDHAAHFRLTVGDDRPKSPPRPGHRGSRRVRRDGRHRGPASLRQPFLRRHSGPIMTV